MGYKVSYIRKILINKIFIYISTRYITYLIQFINSIFIAIYLGPYYLGIWGFITLVIQYLSQINFGISHSVNIFLAINKNKKWYTEKIVRTSVVMLLFLSLLVLLFFVANEIFNLNIGNKYNFTKYYLYVVSIGIFGYYNTLFSNIYRVFGKIELLAFNQSIFPILMIIAIIFFRGENLLWALIISNLMAYFTSFVLYIIYIPINIKPLIILRLAKSIQKKGCYLFIYNASFYLIIISTKSYISTYYSISEFGLFTFSFTLANAILLLLDSFSYLIYPKLINRFALANKEKTESIIEMVRSFYIMPSHFLFYITLVFSPIFFKFFTQYEQAQESFIYIITTFFIYTNSYGYSAILIAKGEEKKISYISLSALILNISIAFLLINIFKIAYSQVIIATLFAYMFYTIAVICLYYKKILIQNCFRKILNTIFPFKLIIPYLVLLTIIIIKIEEIYIIPILIFMYLNFNDIIKLFIIIKKSLTNTSLINI